MTDLQQELVPETPTGQPRRPRVNGWLAGGLVVALVALVGLGAWVFYDHNQAPGLTGTQAAAVAAVDAHLAAMNGTDPASLRDTATADVVWMTVGAGGITDGPLAGEEYFTFIEGLRPSFRIASLGDPVVAGDSVIAVPVRISGDAVISENGVTLFTVRDDGGQLKVSELVFMTEPTSRVN